MTKVLLSHPPRPASHNSSRAMVWVRKNLFSSWSNSLLTIGCIWLMWELIPPLLNWAFLQANWVGSTRADCTKAGACWVFIHERFGQFMYGLYPHDQRWRINLALLIGLVSIAPMFWKILPHRGRYIAAWAVIYPLIVWWLMYGGFFALERVETRQWGGLTLTLIIASVGIAGALPWGILLALGRRSHMPIVRILSVIFIEFGKVTLRVNSDGSVVRLKDVARVELGGENYNVIARINGKPAAGLGIKLATGANALDTAKAIKAKLAELQPFFPQGMKVLYPYDTTPFVQLSIHEVVKTLFEAIMLVFLVMYLFLQNMRATLIPTIAVPVVLLGTFAILAAFGYSINTLTMFGMVLAIGLLVDDAIVVVENVERVMMEDKLPPKEATEKSMSQIQGALVGIAMVLSAVFIPMAFFGGSTGAIYRQFSITIVSAMALSVLVALILTPALCATLLKPVSAEHHENKGGFFGWFNTTFDHSVNHYTNSVGKILGSTGRYLLIYALIVAGMVVLFLRLPSSFLPEEDQGVFLTMIQLPAGATQERTQKVLDQVTDYYLKNEKANVESVFTVNGFSFSGQAQNAGMAFVSLKPWEERNGDENSAEAVIHRAKMELGKIRDGFVIPFNMPAIVELGTATGFDFELIDQAGLGHDALTQARNQLLGMAAQHPASLVSVRPNGLEDTAQFKLEVDQEKAQALGVSLSDINQTISTALGGTYVNDFIDRGRVKKLYVQADAKFRMLPEDVDKLYVRSANGEMVPFSAFTTSHWVYGSPRLERYNGLPSMEIQGEAAPGTSSGDAMALMENLASKLPAGIGYDWTGMSYQERLSGNQAPALVAISFVVVFLCLAALYESWSIPVSVMLVVPLGIVGVLLAATLFNQKNDVYFMVGLLTTIGLSAKNAILIVEFAKDLMEKEGKGVVEATLMAVRMRLRPILMTSLAFILGVLPLAISNGAGSGAQNAVGIGVMGGMVSATLLAIFFVPVFFVVIRRCFKG